MSGERYDVFIRGGTLIDASGTPGIRTNVAIRGDRIAAIGPLPDAEATRVIDAGARVVTRVHRCAFARRRGLPVDAA